MTNTFTVVVNDPTVNPSQLLPQFLNSLGPGVVLLPDHALENFNENPYIVGSDNWHTFRALKRQRDLDWLKRFAKTPDVPVVKLPSKRRLSQPAFKPEFETLHDIRLRLCNGAIFIGANMFYVRDVLEAEDDYLLLLRDVDSVEYKCMYSKTPDIDLRSPEPQYIMYEDKPVFFMRPPWRQHRQALNHENIAVKHIGSKEFIHGEPREVMRGISRESMIWSQTYCDLMMKMRALRSLRLSKNVTFWRKDRTVLAAEYKGRELGEVHEDTIFVSDTDVQKPWIRRDVREIGCVVKEKS